MALLDVSEVLDDPLFRDDTLVRRRTTQTVDDHGRAQPSYTNLPFSGVVTAAGGQELDRRPEGSVIHETILVHTKTELTTGSGNIDADVVLWSGVEYTVTGVDDYSTYGVGFYAAVCKLRPLGNV